MKSAIQIFLVVLLICALLVPGFGIASAQGSSSPTTLELQAGTYTVKLTFPGGEGKRTEMATFNRDPMVKVFVATQLNLEHVVTDVPIDVRIDVDGLPTDVWRLRVDYSDSLYTILKKYEDNTQSFKLLAQKGDSITDSSNRYDVRIDYKLSSGDWESAWVRFVLVLVEPTIEQKIGTISGRVALNDSKSRYPYGGVRNALVKLQLGGVTYTSYTNEGGFYSFDAQKLGVEFKEGDILTLTLCLQDGIDQGGIRRRYMTIVDVGASSAAVPVSIERVSQITETDFQLPVSEQNEPWAGMKQVDFIFEKAIIPVGYASRSNAALLPALVREYMAFEDAVDFALNKLGATITEVEVRVNDANACTNCMVSPVQYGDKAACYDSSPSPDNIIMGTGYTKPLPDTSSFERPTETEFHEFGHHIMGNQRLVTYPAPHVSHGGMLNPSTHDSLNEGEAEFLMLLIREFKGLYTFKSGDFIRSLPPGIVRGTNYEVNNKAWYQDRGVQQEDLAAASLLWDLYDASSKERLDDVFFPSANPVYDTLGIPLADLWEMLKKPEAMPLWNLYTMLNTKYPDRASDIDSVFIAHGFFRDKEEGNHTYDPPGTTNPAEEPDGVLIVDDEGILMTAWFTGEPFEDLNHDGIRQPAAERFVDLGRTNNYPGGPVYNARTDEVGSAGTYAISARQTWPPIIGSNIYIKDTEVDQVLIKVEFEPEYAYFTFEYVAPVESGLLYVTFPPAQYRTTMSVTPIVDGKLIDKSLQIEDTRYRELMAQSTGRDHFLEHEFDSTTAPPEPGTGTGLTFESRSKPKGSEVLIPLTLKGISETIGNIDLALTYDVAVLEAMEVLQGGLTGDSIFDSAISSGTVRLSLADSQGFSGDGSVAYVKFNVIGAEGSFSELRIYKAEANKSDYSSITLSTHNGLFRVSSIDGQRGDCDGDGKLSAVDALCALQMAVGKKTEDLAMDVTGDGKVTSLDARSILRQALGLG